MLSPNEQQSKYYFNLDDVKWGPYLDKQGDLKNNIFYRKNNYGYRCDDFIEKHDKKHILFSGCSMTSGSGLEESEIWSNMLYQELNKNNEYSGYFNLAISGNTVAKIIYNLFKYFKLFGNPEVIFLLLPPIDRKDKFLKDDLCEQIFFYNYLILEQYCFSNKITLITTFWKDYQNREDNDRFLKNRPFLSREFQKKDVFNSFDTIFDHLISKELIKETFHYIESNKDHPRLWKADDDDIDIYRHPGLESQYSWYRDFKKEYETRMSLYEQ
jgi:hypothetical protein